MFAQPPTGLTLQDCDYYHVIDLPGHGQVGVQWDLRGHVDEYLGGYEFAGRSVLEIGPASGFLTAEIEQRGAAVVALEMPPEAGWDYVPYPPEILDPVVRARVDVMRRLRNSFWFTHATFGLKARLAYASAYDIPAALGRFDVAVLACVLLHCHSPMRIVEQCARRADTIIITEMHDPGLDGLRSCQFLPTAENQKWDTWWRFSPDLFVDFLRVMGFRGFSQTFHTQQTAWGPQRLFTLIASRDEMESDGRHAAKPLPNLNVLQASVTTLRQELEAIRARTP